MKKKKIIITLIVIALILVLVGFIAEKVQQKNKEYEIAQIKEYKYFVVKENDKYGVINTNGEKIVKTEYDDVKIPNPETVTKNFDEPQQDTTTATVEQSLSNIEEQQDETSEMTNSEASIQPEQELNFMKLNNNTPRAILTSAKQISNLRQSLATQEALVNSREEIGSININGVEDDVQNLVSNGLLSPSEENIEDMLNEASALYKEGKVEQAQGLYEKISELNKKIKDTENEENKEKELTKSNSNLIAA